MSLLEIKKNKNLILLALASAGISVIFSFLGAPFLRAFSVSARSGFFWLTAAVLVGAMLLAGSGDYKISEAAIYVGSIWMTLGAYSELEKRGTGWRPASVISLAAGLLFAVAGYFLVLRNLGTADHISDMVAPLTEAINKSFPDLKEETEFLKNSIPGILTATLAAALALGFVFEATVSRLFGIRRERVVSGLRWIEFRLSDAAIWIFLVSALVAIAPFGGPELPIIIGANFLIVLAFGLFCQGMATVEFMIRFYRLGAFTRMMIYVLILLQLAPIIVFVGFADHWADFRRLVRKKSKAN